METITIRINKEDKELLKKFSKSKGMTLSNWSRQQLLEAVENEYDIETINEYLSNQSNIELFTNEAIREELNL